MEMHEDRHKIYRPRQIYTGPTEQEYVDVDDR
jgi:citrate synthase